MSACWQDQSWHTEATQRKSIMGICQPKQRCKCWIKGANREKERNWNTSACWQNQSWRIVARTGKRAKQGHISLLAGSCQPKCWIKGANRENERNWNTSACWQDQSWRIVERTGKRAQRGHISLLAGSVLAHCGANRKKGETGTRQLVASNSIRSQEENE